MFQYAAPVLHLDAVVEVDAVAVGVGGGVVSGVTIGCCLHGFTGCQGHCAQ